MNSLHLLALKSIDWPGIPQSGAQQTAGAPDQERQIITIIFFATSVILTIWLIARIQSRIQTPQKPHRPYRLFGRLLKHHRLGLADRWMLFVLAGCQGMKQPSLLLLSPGLFAKHADAWLSGSTLGSAWPRARQRLVRIAQQVFAEDAGAKG